MHACMHRPVHYHMILYDDENGSLMVRFDWLFYNKFKMATGSGGEHVSGDYMYIRKFIMMSDRSRSISL